MALLIYSNGMDVRVATVENDKPILQEHYTPGKGLGAYVEVQWEYCGEDNNYRKRCEELERSNETLMKTTQLQAQQMNHMQAKLNKVYGALGVQNNYDA